MLSVADEPLMLTALTAATIGACLVVHARVQSRLLRERIASGTSAEVVDPPTGLFATGAASQIIRAELNRATRLGRNLDVWLGAGANADEIDGIGRELVFSLPEGSLGVRLDARRVCVVSCADGHATSRVGTGELRWTHHTVEPSATAADEVLALGTEPGDG